MGWSESELIVNLAEIFAKPNPDLLVGIGDDAAVVARPTSKVVITTDMAVEDVHFKTRWATPHQIGRKVAAANLADIYAMGGSPKYLVVSMAATGEESLEWMLEVARGIAAEAAICNAQVIGGDLSRGEKIVISITAFGECARPTLRSGAKVGDGIFISNLPGWSAAGLELLKRGYDGSGELENFAISEHLAPSVDYENGISISKSANALCDVSDSILIQGKQMADASGVEFEIDADAISKHPDFAELLHLATEVNCSVFDLVLSGGEDHVFLATGKDLSAFQIGKVNTGSGIRLTHLGKTPQPGWQHF